MASLAIDTLWYSDKGERIIGKTTTSGEVTFLFETGNLAIRGLAWDGVFIWAISLDGSIRKYNTSGGLIDTYTDLLDDGWGLTFDGACLWASSPGADKIYRIFFPGLDHLPPAAPILSCTTHPSEDLWYSDDSPVFSWTEPPDPSGIRGYSYRLDRTPTTDPDTLSEGAATSVSYVGLPDGTWYLHCRASDGAGNWSSTDHHRIRIDTEAPAPPLDAVVAPDTWTNVNLFQLSWTNPADSSSVVGAYCKIGGPPQDDTDGTFTPGSPLFLSVETEGEQTVSLWLEDGAGNRDRTARIAVTLYYDETAPAGGTISINSGDDVTESTIVTLNDLSAVDVLSGMGPGAQMQFSNNSIDWSPVEDYASARDDWGLSLYGGTAQPGQKTVWVRYQDVAGNRSPSFSDDILLVAPLAIVTDSLPGGTVGFAYEETLAATGGVPPYTWSLVGGTLPHHFILDTDGRITGVPDEAGTFGFIVKATDSFSITRLKGLSITVFAGSLRGDVDGNSIVDLLDILRVVRYILGRGTLTPSQLWAADAFNDGRINVSDLVAIAHLVIGRPSGAARTGCSVAELSIIESAPLLDGSSEVNLHLENSGPVAGLQLTLGVPRGAELMKRPLLAGRCAAFNMDFSESDNGLSVLVYSFSGDAISPDSGPVLRMYIGPCTDQARERRVTLTEATVVGMDGRRLSVTVRHERVPVGQESYTVAHSFPNPFNPETFITFSLEREGRVSTSIYDILGRRVRTLTEGTMGVGVHTVRWDGCDEGGVPSPSGVYYCRIEGEIPFQTAKLTLIR